jgi:ribosomal protein S18 acetylase RimI-like enzyme
VDARDVRFRFAAETDVAAVVGLVESCYRGEASRAGWTTEADLLDGQRTDSDEVTRVVRSPRTRLLLAEVSHGGPHVLAGCCKLEQHADGIADFGMFAVRPDLQGRGLGEVVRAEAERVAGRVWGAHEMRLMVLRPRDALIGWYARRGYHDTGQRVPFPYGDERYGIPKRPGLEFAVLTKPLGSVHGPGTAR